MPAAMRLGTVPLALVLTAVGGLLAAAPPSPLLLLENGRVTLGLLPSFGGRVVLFKTPEGPNVLDARWREPFPKAALDTRFEDWNGHVVWAGPQSAWWTRQDLVPERNSQKAVWPPDPFNEAASYEILERSPVRVRMRGPASPVSGLAFEQEIELLEGRRARLRVTATNRRSMPVSWDIWPNTRVQPAGTAFVPLAAGTAVRADDGPRGPVGAYPHRVSQGWLSVEPGHEPTAPVTTLRTKLFPRAARGLTALFLDRQVFLKRASLVPAERLHPDHTFIEIYRGSGQGGEILELEMHGSYETLAPGASMRFEETWELLDYGGAAETSARILFLERLAP
jgi:Domain of unknown function (DUF4380)